MAKFMRKFMTGLAVMVIALAYSGCSTTNNITERSDKPTVKEKTTEHHSTDTEKHTESTDDSSK